MATALTLTRTLAVNPAFLQEIKDSNRELWHTLHEVRQLSVRNDLDGDQANRFVRLLDELRDHLALQFALEEAYGYTEIPASMQVAHAALAQQACQQHCSLFLQVSDLAEQAMELQYRGFEPRSLMQLLVESRRFDADLRRHEQLEATFLS